MLISQVNSSKNNNFMQYKNLYASKINFRGQLETDYFEVAKTGNIQKQLKSISNLGFDVNEKDIETQDNFLHVAIRSKSKQLINKALIVLGQKEPDLINAIIDETNSDGKKPYEYARDLEIISRLENMANKKLSYPSEIKKEIKEVQTQTSKQNESPVNKLNELPEGTKIVIPDDDDDNNNISETKIEPSIVNEISEEKNTNRSRQNNFAFKRNCRSYKSKANITKENS